MLYLIIDKLMKSYKYERFVGYMRTIFIHTAMKIKNSQSLVS